jgi:hypothetical protein
VPSADTNEATQGRVVSTNVAMIRPFAPSRRVRSIFGELGANERQFVERAGEREDALDLWRTREELQLEAVAARRGVEVEYQAKTAGVQEREAAQVEDEAIDAGTPEVVD